MKLINFKMTVSIDSDIWHGHNFAAKSDMVTHKSKMAETNKSPFLRNLQDIVIARRRSCSFTEYWKHFMARLKVNGVHAFGYDLDEIWGTLSTLFAAGPGSLADFGRDWRRSESERASRNFVFLSDKQRAISPTSRQPNFTKFAHNMWIDESFWNKILKISP